MWLYTPGSPNLSTSILFCSPQPGTVCQAYSGGGEKKVANATGWFCLELADTTINGNGATVQRRNAIHVYCYWLGR